MFFPETIIDTIQNTKRIVANQLIKDADLNRAANDYITAQTAFAKTLLNSSLDFTNYGIAAINKFTCPSDMGITKAARAKAARAESSAARTTDTNTQGE